LSSTDSGTIGEVRLGERSVRVNVLPLAYLWAGDIMLDDHKADPRMWQVYADGELIARIARQNGALMPLLTSR
jgi:hypothetical protein